MLNFLAKILVGLGLWTYFRGRIGQFAFLILGILLVWYSAGEVESFLILTQRESYLASLLVIKNSFYLAVVLVFVIWPLIFKKNELQKTERTGVKTTTEGLQDVTRMRGDGFDHIRNRRNARSAAEIELDDLENT